jgi:hypothetical protein
VKIPLQYRSGDVAIVAAKLDGKLTIGLVPYTSGEPIEVESDDDEVVFTWVLRQEDFVGPDGTALDTAKLSQIAARLESSSPDPSGATGSCDRGLAPARETPQMINDGDACRIPPFVRGALWRPSDSGVVCSGASDSEVCATGPEADGARSSSTGPARAPAPAPPNHRRSTASRSARSRRSTARTRSMPTHRTHRDGSPASPGTSPS